MRQPVEQVSVQMLAHNRWHPTQMLLGEIGLIRTDRADRIWLVALVPSDGPIGYYRYDKEMLRAVFAAVGRRPDNGSDPGRPGRQRSRIKQAEAEQIVAALRSNGVPHEYLLFHDEGHGLAKPENRERYYAAAERFLAGQLAGRMQP